MSSDTKYNFAIDKALDAADSGNTRKLVEFLLRNKPANADDRDLIYNIVQRTFKQWNAGNQTDYSIILLVAAALASKGFTDNQHKQMEKMLEEAAAGVTIYHYKQEAKRLEEENESLRKELGKPQLQIMETDEMAV